MKNGKMMVLAALLIMGLIAGSAWAANQPGPVQTNTETQQADLGECPDEPMQVQRRVCRELLQSRGDRDRGEMRANRVQRHRFGK